jgi:hypothetical protein
MIKIILDFFSTAEEESEQKPETEPELEDNDGDEYWNVDINEDDAHFMDSHSNGVEHPEQNMVQIYIADSVAQARLIQLALDEAEIPSSTFEPGMSMLPFAGDSIDAVTIIVPEEQEEKAREVIDKYLQQSEHKKSDSPDDK